MKWLIQLLVLSVVIGPLSAAEPPAGPADTQTPTFKTIAEKRAWLQNQALKGVRDPRQAQALVTSINNLKPQEIDVVLNSVLAQQLPPARDARDIALQQAQWELQRAIALRQALQREYYRRYGGVGYMPVITWLPQGTSLGASAVVSPDRRHVRISTQPFFSSVGPVYTYNLNTGETRLMPPYSYYSTPYPNGYPLDQRSLASTGQTQRRQPMGYPSDQSGYRTGQMPPQHLPPQSPSQPSRRIWYDGMRTRVGR